MKIWTGMLVCFSLTAGAAERDMISFSEPHFDFNRMIADSPQNLNEQFFSSLAPGVLIDEEPLQAPISPYKWILKKNYRLGISDAFTIKGVVISKRQYLADERSDIAPLDLVIGWKKMSDPSVLKDIDVRQNNRFYYWHVNEFPLPRAELEASSANLHIIPKTKKIAQMLNQLSKGQLIELKGFLVDVKTQDGYIWSTSRSRTDSGDGACEIMLVSKIQRIKPQ